MQLSGLGPFADGAAFCMYAVQLLSSVFTGKFLLNSGQRVSSFGALLLGLVLGVADLEAAGRRPDLALCGVAHPERSHLVGVGASPVVQKLGRVISGAVGRARHANIA